MGKRDFTRLLTVIALCLPGLGWAACADNKVSLRGDWGNATFTVAVADDAAERSRGLMFVEQMPRFTGMLFVYDRPQRVAFWMRNTLIPLDMIFADAQGVVQRIHANAVPGDETSIPGGDDIQYVLEINGGLSAVLGMGPGTQMQHPSIAGGEVVWPCPNP